jgi:hypothetical protein
MVHADGKCPLKVKSGKARTEHNMFGLPPKAELQILALNENTRWVLTIVVKVAAIFLAGVWS